MNRGETTLLFDACLATLTIWLCRMAVQFGFLCTCWNKGCFKHKKGSFLFSQTKTLKTAEFKRMKRCFVLTEIAKSVIEINDQTLMNKYLQTCSANITSGLRIMVADKVIKSSLSSPNSVYNGMSIGNSIRHNYWKNKLSSTITILLLRL